MEIVGTLFLILLTLPDFSLFYSKFFFGVVQLRHQFVFFPLMYPLSLLVQCPEVPYVLKLALVLVSQVLGEDVHLSFR